MLEYVRYTNSELRAMLHRHKLWLERKALGEGANLSHAELGGVNLSGLDLSHANFTGANLSRANLSRSCLYGANLSNANLSFSELSMAQVDGANFSGAHLQGAHLTGAKIKSFYLGRDFGYSWVNSNGETIVKIGCEEHKLSDWLVKYEEIGKKNYYSEASIDLYLGMLKLIAKSSGEFHGQEHGSKQLDRRSFWRSIFRKF